MKVQPSVKKICDKCKVIRRHGRVMPVPLSPGVPWPLPERNRPGTIR